MYDECFFFLSFLGWQSSLCWSNIDISKSSLSWWINAIDEKHNFAAIEVYRLLLWYLHIFLFHPCDFKNNMHLDFLNLSYILICYFFLNVQCVRKKFQQHKKSDRTHLDKFLYEKPETYFKFSVKITERLTTKFRS